MIDEKKKTRRNSWSKTHLNLQNEKKQNIIYRSQIISTKEQIDSELATTSYTFVHQQKEWPRLLVSQSRKFLSKIICLHSLLLTGKDNE